MTGFGRAQQVRDGGLAHEEVAVDVDAHHLPVRRLRDLCHVFGAGDPGDVAEDVEPAELRDRGVHRSSTLRGQSHVRDASHDDAVGGFAGGIKPGLVDVDGEHVGTFTGEAQSCSATDSGRRSGDQGSFAVEAAGFVAHVSLRFAKRAR